jgi:hypothetical protein
LGNGETYPTGWVSTVPIDNVTSTSWNNAAPSSTYLPSNNTTTILPVTTNAGGKSIVSGGLLGFCGLAVFALV